MKTRRDLLFTIIIMSKSLCLIFVPLVLVGNRNMVNAADLSQGNNMLREDSRIIGGTFADEKNYAFLVSIQIFYSGWSHHCVGSIVSSHVVLTACHCLVSSYDPIPVYRHPQSLRVVAGTADLSAEFNPNKQIVSALKLEVHPRCGGGKLLHDAGVIILKENLRLNDHVKPAPFPTGDSQKALKHLNTLEEMGAQCHDPGWGSTTRESYNPSSRLKVLPVFLMTSAKCNQTFCALRQNCATDYATDNQVCADNKDGIFCHGDSGGPLVCNGYVFGVVSFSYGCYPGWPMVYSDIMPVLDVVDKYRTNHG